MHACLTYQRVMTKTGDIERGKDGNSKAVPPSSQAVQGL